MLEERIQELDGYVEAMDTYNGSSYSGYNSNRSAHLTVRIPSGKLDGFLDTVSDIGNIVRRHNNVEDVQPVHQGGFSYIRPADQSGKARLILLFLHSFPAFFNSDLMNRLIGQKIAITSAKPQTTRNRIRTVLTTG